MLYRSYTPASPLADFIEDFWLYDDYRPAHLKERILPSGTTELVINLRNNESRIYDRGRPGLCERFSGAIVSGTYERFFGIDTAEEMSVLGVHFKPGGAFPFFGLPVSELIDTHLDLEILWRRSARDLRDRLRAATVPIDKFRIIEATLLARLSGPVMRHGAVRFALDAFGDSTPMTVRDVTERVGLSHRRFIELFKAEVGLTPKLFHRMQRFQRVLGLVRRVTAPDWSRLALDCRFFDQSHLIRDFVGFSGFSPAEFARHQRALERLGLKRHHLPLVEEGASFPNTMTAPEATMSPVAFSVRRKMNDDHRPRPLHGRRRRGRRHLLHDSPRLHSHLQDSAGLCRRRPRRLAVATQRTEQLGWAPDARRPTALSRRLGRLALIPALPALGRGQGRMVFPAGCSARPFGVVR